MAFYTDKNLEELFKLFQQDKKKLKKEYKKYKNKTKYYSVSPLVQDELIMFPDDQISIFSNKPTNPIILGGAPIKIKRSTSTGSSIWWAYEW